MKLINESSINFLKKTSLKKTFIAIAIDYGYIALAITIGIIYKNLFIYLLAILIIGSRMRALENLVHEASHVNLCKKQKVNNFIGLLFCAIPIFSSLNAYRISHFKHHRYLGNYENDPDLIRYKLLGIDKLPSGKSNLIINFMKIISLYHMPKYLYGTLLTFVYDNQASKAELYIRLSCYLLASYIFTITESWYYFLIFWIIPFFTVFQIIRYFAEISEHGGLYSEKEKIKMTRNNICHPILRFILYPHNDSYHLLHHLIPGIPFYNLKQAHQILLSDSLYRSLNHCHGYFFKTNHRALPTTLSQMLQSAHGY